MKNTLYLECNAGISGDMTVAALIDLGADKEKLKNALNSIPISGFDIEIKRVKKAGVDCQSFSVITDSNKYDYDMEYLHSHDHEHHHDHHEHHHDHEHNHEHHYDHHHEHSHEHRNLTDIIGIIDGTNISDNAKKIAKDIFDVIALAEAKAHDKPVNEVHFHEVGAVDSIVDIIATAFCIDDLKIKEVIVPYLCEGVGTVRCAHGILPVPVPAVVNIVTEHGINLKIMNHKGEFVTPTGAAIVAALKTKETLPDTMKIVKVGMGAGKREYVLPSILRAMLIDDDSIKSDFIYKLESNIDDCTGEALGRVLDILMREGAKDVHYSPVYMKKNRPGWQINVICDPKDVKKIENIIFKETTTIGIRKQKMERSILKREIKTIDTRFGVATIKICSIGNEVKYYPEYESVASLADSNNKSYQEMYELIRNISMGADNEGENLRY